MEDQAIIELYWNRDEAAIRETDAVYGNKLQSLSEHILDSREDARECVNDTYLKTWESIPPERPNFFFAFLSKICRFISFGRMDWNNAAKRRADLVSLTAELEACVPDRRVQEQLEAKELGKILSAFIATLPADSRLIFLRRYWHLDTTEEIAKNYGFSVSKVKTQLHRTRAKLYSYLEKEGIAV